MLSDAGAPPAGDSGMPVDQDSGTVTPGDDSGVSTMPSQPEDGGPAAQATPGKAAARSGCGCRLASGGSPLVAGAGLVSLLALLAGRRRRR